MRVRTDGLQKWPRSVGRACRETHAPVAGGYVGTRTRVMTYCQQRKKLPAPGTRTHPPAPHPRARTCTRVYAHTRAYTRTPGQPHAPPPPPPWAGLRPRPMTALTPVAIATGRAAAAAPAPAPPPPVPFPPPPLSSPRPVKCRPRGAPRGSFGLVARGDERRQRLTRLPARRRGAGGTLRPWGACGGREPPRHRRGGLSR